MKKEEVVKQLKGIIENLSKEKGNIKTIIKLDNLLLEIMDAEPKKYYGFKNN